MRFQEKHSTVDPTGSLEHPVFWASLCALAVNDHILKRVQDLPGLITGKLSDFAGLLVAPVLLCALFRVRGRMGRTALFSLITSVFVGVKVSRPVADTLETISAYSLLPWRLWCDPTDLVALSVLPLAWWVAEGKAKERAGSPAKLKRHLRVPGLALGLLACAATSAETRSYRGTAFLFNGTRRAELVRLYRLQDPLDCTRSIDSPSIWPGRDAFVLEECRTLAMRDILPLDQGWKDLGETSDLGDFNVSHYDAGMIGPPCDAVLLQAEGLRPVVVTWNGVSAIEFNGAERFGDDAGDAHGLVLERAGDRLFIGGTSLLRVLPADFEPATTECPNGER